MPGLVTLLGVAIVVAIAGPFRSHFQIALQENIATLVFAKETLRMKQMQLLHGPKDVLVTVQIDLNLIWMRTMGPHKLLSRSFALAHALFHLNAISGAAEQWN